MPNGYHPPTLIERIKTAIDEADEAFWSVITDKFPEATSGDMDPPSVMRQTEEHARCVIEWLYWNTDLMNDKSISVRDVT